MEWIRFKAKFDGECKICGMDMDEGNTVYGTKDPSLAAKGKWYVICPLCYKNRKEDGKDKAVEPKKGLEPIELPAVPVVMDTDMMKPSDVEDLKALLAEGVAVMMDDCDLPTSFAAEWIGDVAAAVPSFTPFQPTAMPKQQEDAIFEEIKENAAVKPWSLEWIKQNAAWGV